MDEQIKDRLLIALIILSIICLILAINSGLAAQKNKAMAQKELALRLDTEEKFEDVKSRFNFLEKKVVEARTAYEKEKKAHSENKDELATLKEDYEKLNILKLKIEEDLKEALFIKSQEQ